MVYKSLRYFPSAILGSSFLLSNPYHS